MSKRVYRWLHVAPGGDWAGFPSRASRTMTAFAQGVVHDVVAASPGFRLPDGVRGGEPVFPDLSGAPTPGKLNRIAKALAPYDLVLTHGYEAMNVAMAHTAFSQAYELPPLVHHEPETSRAGEGKRTDWYRRVALGRSSGVVVPTERLENRALVDWQQPMGRVKYIPDGVALEDFRKSPKPDSLPRLIKRPGEAWIGTAVASDNFDLAELFAVLSDLPDYWHLVVLGGGDTHSLIERAAALGIDDRVHVPNQSVTPKAILGLFDVAVVPSGSNVPSIVPMSAMAAGVPVIQPGQFDGYDALPDALQALTDVRRDLPRLASSTEEREKLGKLAREHARTAFDAVPMWAKLRRLYSSAMGVTDLK